MGVYKKLIVLGLVAIALAAGGFFLVRGASIPVLQPTGQTGESQLDLFVFAGVLSVIVVIPVFLLLMVFAIRYRASNVNARYEPDWSENKLLEGLWWGIPVAIIVLLGAVTWVSTHQLDPYKSLAKSGEDEMRVQVVALRWKWLFFYPDQGVASLNYVSLPVDTPVQFVLTADAPMSAFWIPSLGSQIYTMNSMRSRLHSRANEIGQYKGYNTSINGEGYSKMTFNTNVMSRQDFDEWAEKAAQSDAVLDRTSYTNMVEPKSVQDERTYRLSDKNLFDDILGEAMMGSHGAGSAKSHEATDSQESDGA